MYFNRIKRKSEGHSVFYLVTNHVTQNLSILGDEEKAMMRNLLFKGEESFGYRVWDYVIMSNHYHALIEIPDKSLMPKERVIRLWRLNKRVSSSVVPGKEAIERFRDRLHDISKIIGNFQQRFTQWYNRKHNSRGKLFASRFDNVLVDQNGMLSKMMGYITTNSVRTGLVEEPSLYPWCGYSERMKNGKLREEDRLLVTMLKDELNMDENADEGPEEEALARLWDAFRRDLLGHPTEMKSEELADLKNQLNEENRPLDMPWNERMQLTVTFASKGVAVGSKDFVEGVAEEFRDALGIKERKAREARSWDGTYSIVNHRKWVK